MGTGEKETFTSIKENVGEYSAKNVSGEWLIEMSDRIASTYSIVYTMPMLPHHNHLKDALVTSGPSARW